MTLHARIHARIHTRIDTRIHTRIDKPDSGLWSSHGAADGVQS